MKRRWCLTRCRAVFTGKLTSILPVVPGGSYQAQGALQSLTVVPGTDGVLGTIELIRMRKSMRCQTVSMPGGGLLGPFRPRLGDA